MENTRRYGLKETSLDPPWFTPPGEDPGPAPFSVPGISFATISSATSRDRRPGPFPGVAGRYIHPFPPGSNQYQIERGGAGIRQSRFEAVPTWSFGQLATNHAIHQNAAASNDGCLLGAMHPDCGTPEDFDMDEFIDWSGGADDAERTVLETASAAVEVSTPALQNNQAAEMPVSEDETACATRCEKTANGSLEVSGSEKQKSESKGMPVAASADESVSAVLDGIMSAQDGSSSDNNVPKTTVASGGAFDVVDGAAAANEGGGNGIVQAFETPISIEDPAVGNNLVVQNESATAISPAPVPPISRSPQRLADLIALIQPAAAIDPVFAAEQARLVGGLPGQTEPGFVRYGDDSGPASAAQGNNPTVDGKMKARLIRAEHGRKGDKSVPRKWLSHKQVAAKYPLWGATHRNVATILYKFGKELDAAEDNSIV